MTKSNVSVSPRLKKQRQPNQKHWQLDDLLSVRSSSSGIGREILTRHGWVKENEVKRQVLDEFAAHVDINDKHTGFSKYDNTDKHERRILDQKRSEKARFDQHHCELVRQVLCLCVLSCAAHILLMHPSELTTAKALLALGIPMAQLHVPNSFAYFGCCGQGVANVYHCLLEVLAST